MFSKKIATVVYVLVKKKIDILFMESPDRNDYIRKPNADHICKHEWRMENPSSPSVIRNAKRTTVMQGYPLML